MTAALLSFDEEVALRIDESLPEVLGRFLLSLDREDGPKHGWRPWCRKHNELLVVYTRAAILHTRARREWRHDSILCRSEACEHCTSYQRAEDRLDAARAFYRRETCTCLIETVTPLPDTGPRAAPRMVLDPIDFRFRTFSE